MINLAEVACRMEYEGVEQMLNRICWKFKTTHGGDWDELKSVANLAFIKAWDNYNDSRSAFTTYCWHYVWGYLMNYTTSRLKQKVNCEADETVAYRPLSLEELSDDANTVIRLVLSTVVDWHGVARRQDDIRWGLWKTLKKELNWSAKRVMESFEEIREALR
jgi:hypothetical protein